MIPAEKTGVISQTAKKTEKKRIFSEMRLDNTDFYA